MIITWNNISQVDPRDFHALRLAALATPLADRVKYDVERSVDAFRHDFNVWTPSLEFRTAEGDRIVLDFKNGEDRPRFIKYTRAGDVVDATYPLDDWAIKNRSTESVVNYSDRDVVELFDNSRVWDSFYRACDVGLWYEKSGQAELKYAIAAESIIDPSSFLSGASFALRERLVPQRGAAHVVQAIYQPITDAQMLEFVVRLHGVATSRGAVLISFDAEKRVWENQAECLASFLRNAHKISPVRHVFVNGMTAPARGGSVVHLERQRALEQEIAQTVLNLSGLRCQFENLFGLTLMQKLRKFKVCSFFVAPAGSAMVLPSALSVPGVAVGFGETLEFRQNLQPNLVARLPTHMASRSEEKGLNTYSWASTAEHTSYRLSQDDFVRFALAHYQKTVLESEAAK